MSRTKTHSSSTTLITIVYCDKRAFAFSPNIAKVTLGSAYAENAEVTLEMNGYTQKRNCVGRTCTFILDSLFQSYFKGSVFDIAETGTTATMVLDKTITVKATHGTTLETVTLDGSTYATDIVWGALQLGQTEPTEEYIYSWDGLPMTITDTLSSGYKIKFVNGNAKEKYVAGTPTTYKGKNIDFDAALTTFKSEFNPLLFNPKQFMTSETVLNVIDVDFILTDNGTAAIKTYHIDTQGDCVDGKYIRWIDALGEYKYHVLQQASDATDSKNGESFKHYPTSSAATDGYIRSRNQLITKTIGKAIQCGVQAADDKVTELLRGCQNAIKHWVYENNTWVEVTLEDSNISKVRTENTRQIDFKFRYSDLYTQSL